MPRDFSIQRKLLLPILVRVTFVLTLSAIVTVGYIDPVERLRNHGFFRGAGRNRADLFQQSVFFGNSADYRMVIESFRRILKNDSTVDRISEEFASSEELRRAFATALDSLKHTAIEAERMKNQTEQQASSLRGINANIQSISEASDQIVHGILESFSEITVVNDRVKDLSHSAGAFKID